MNINSDLNIYFERFCELNERSDFFDGKSKNYKLRLFIFLIYSQSDGLFLSKKIVNIDDYIEGVGYKFNNIDKDKITFIGFIDKEDENNGEQITYKYFLADDLTNGLEIINEISNDNFRNECKQYIQEDDNNQVDIPSDYQANRIVFISNIDVDNFTFNENKWDSGVGKFSVDDCLNEINYLQGSLYPYVSSSYLIKLPKEHNNYFKFEKSIVCNLYASTISDIYNKYHAKGLFDANVRKYIHKKAIDDKLIDSIKNKGDDFWYYNNGLTFVCQEINEDKSNDSIKINNFSIINGAQTTTLIGKNWNSNFNDFNVLVRFICINSDDISNDMYMEKLSSISEFLNTQKKLNSANLLSNDPQIRKLKQYINDEKISIYLSTKDGEKNTLKADIKTRIQNYKGFITLEKFLQNFSIFFLQSPYLISNKAVCLNRDKDYVKFFESNYMIFKPNFYEKIWYFFENIRITQKELLKDIKKNLNLYENEFLDANLVLKNGYSYFISLFGLYLLTTYNSEQFLNEFEKIFYNINNLSETDKKKKLLALCSKKLYIKFKQFDIKNEGIIFQEFIKKITILINVVFKRIARLNDSFANFRKTDINYIRIIDKIYNDRNLRCQWQDICELLIKSE